VAGFSETFGSDELNIIAAARCSRPRIPIGIAPPCQYRPAAYDVQLRAGKGDTTRPQAGRTERDRSIKIKVPRQYRAGSEQAEALPFARKTTVEQIVKEIYPFGVGKRLAQRQFAGSDRNLCRRPEKATTFAEPRCPNARLSPSGSHLFDMTRGPQGTRRSHGHPWIISSHG
jgi:hypothetical protein